MRTALAVFSTFLFVCLCVLQTAAHAQDWTRLRGPNGQGVSDATTVPVTFSEKQYNWKIKLPGEGHGSPVVWGKKLFVTVADKKSAVRHLVCIDTRTGKSSWKHEFKTNTFRMHSFNHYGTATPAVDGEHVYTYVGGDKECFVAALTHDGKPAWQMPLGSVTGKHGPSTSPMVYKDLLIVTHDQDPSGAVYAFDKKTGKQRWHLKRNGAGNGASYGVPVILKGADGKDQLIVISKGNGMTAIDPSQGKVLWEMDDLFPLRCVTSPIIAGDVILGQCGSGGGGKRFVAVKAGNASGGKGKLLWETKRSIPYVPAPLIYKGNMYYLTDGGQAACMDPKTGDVHWLERAGERLSFFGSPVCINGNIYAISKDGKCVVFKASVSKFELLATNDLGETSYATPAVSGGVMYLRTFTHLISVGGAKVN